MISSNLVKSSLKLALMRTCPYHPSLLMNRPLIAFISTSKRTQDGGATTTAGESGGDKPDPQDFSYEAAKKKWVSFGFHWESEEEDINTRNTFLFTSITCMFVGFGFLAAYWPDVKRKGWAQRQAYIELARREALGLPPIDENIVPPERINLPTEEELGDFDIIV